MVGPLYQEESLSVSFYTLNAWTLVAKMSRQRLLFLGYRRLGPGRTGQIFVYFAKNLVINSLRQVRPVIQINQILSKLTKLQRRRHPASEQDKFLSDVKSDRFVYLHAIIWRKMSIKKNFSWRVEVWSPLKLYRDPEHCSRTMWSLHWHIVEVATASAWVKRIQGRKKARTQAIMYQGNIFDLSG